VTRRYAHNNMTDLEAKHAAYSPPQAH